MTAALPLPSRSPLARMYGWRRLAWALGLAAVAGLMISPSFPRVPTWNIIGREMIVALACLTAFGLLERWPSRLPRWLARWVMQVLLVAAVIPFTVLAIYVFATPAGDPPFYRVESRVNGFFHTTMVALVIAPWATVAALFNQGEFEKERLERQALDARLRLIESQIEPHFLFNTLANVRELVEEGSPQAAKVLNSLIAYLRASVPRLHDPATTMGHELQLVKAYLELMQMRMPDRLQFAVDADPATHAVRCPPTTILTLVENAVRHGIDPSEEGGRIDVRARLRDGRCIAEVSDTGVGLSDASPGTGSGLTTLRERLQLAFGGKAQLRIQSLGPHGVRAEVEFPAT